VGVAANLRQRAIGEHAPVIENDHVIAILGFFQEVRSHDYGHALLCHSRNATPKFAACKGIGAAGGLVEKQHLGFME
jgi:hypothetical protein